MKVIEFKNKLNGEKVHCNNVREVRIIDEVDYLVVYKPGTNRQFLMRKDVLEKIGQKIDNTK
jgi:hypothetical protein